MNSRWNTGLGKALRCVVALSLVLSVVLLTGCGGGSKGVVSGKVTTKALGKDEPVTGGTLTFAPVAQGGNPGAPVSVEIKPEGTYSVSGVVPGKCKVIYVPPPATYPPGHTPKPSEPAPESRFKNLVPSQQEIEVKAGNNTIDIEMVIGKPS